MDKREEFKQKLEQLFDEYDVNARVLIHYEKPVVQFSSPDFFITNHQLWKPNATCMFGNSLDFGDRDCALLNHCKEHQKLSGISDTYVKLNDLSNNKEIN